MATSATSICNMALARIGGRRINSYDDASDTKPEALYCRLFYEQTAKALMKDHYWPFAKDRVQLSQTTAPAFQYTYAYTLPNDFLRIVCFYNGADNASGRTEYTYEIEGSTLLTDEETCYLKYIKWVPSEADWDPLFVECLILQLAKKLCMPLSQDTEIKADLDRDLIPLMRQVRAMDRMDEERPGRYDLKPWREGRYVDTA